MLTYLNGNGYIDVDRAMAFVILAAVIAYGLGKIHTEGKTVKLMQELHVAEQEVEDLREFIWLTSLSAPAAPVDVVAQALPNPSPVERLRHHNSQQGGALA